MRNLSKSKKIIFTVAIVLSFLQWEDKISGGDLKHVYYLGFPGTFATLHGGISEFPAGLAINPLQFFFNVGVNWLILSLMVKVFRKLAFRFGYKKSDVD